MRTHPPVRGNGRPLFAVVLVLGVTMAAQVTAGAASVRNQHANSSKAWPASPKPGAWASLGTAQGQSSAALLHVSDGNDLVIWMSPVVPGKTHYEAVELKPDGGPTAKPADVFAGNDWDGVTATPALVSDQRRPLLVFEGSGQ